MLKVISNQVAELGLKLSHLTPRQYMTDTVLLAAHLVGGTGKLREPSHRRKPGVKGFS